MNSPLWGPPLFWKAEMNRDVDFIFQLSSTIEEKKKILDTDKKRISEELIWEDHPLTGRELEARVKKVSEREAKKLIQNYGPWEKTTFSERRYKTSQGTLRERQFGNGEMEFIRKMIIKRVKLYNEWITWALSKEEPIRSSEMDSKFVVSSHKERLSKTVRDVLRLDVTKDINEGVWSVEVEVLDASAKDEIKEYVKNLICFLKGKIRRTTSEMIWNLFSTPWEDFSFTKRRYQKPVTITNGDLNTLKNRRYKMTPKIDGERRFVCILNGEVYTIDLRGAVELFSSSKITHPGKISILDCELSNGELFAFDIIVAFGVYVGSIKYLSKRYSRMNEFSCYVRIKPLFDVPKDWSLIPSMFHQWKDNYKVDGIIFIPSTSNYTKGKLFKWKENNTVDLEVKDGRIRTYDEEEYGKSALEDGIYEFSHLQGRFDMVRVREDKPRANSAAIVKRNLGFMTSFDHCPVTKWAKGGKGMASMRKFHNRVKKIMYDSSDQSFIMDIGTGQGGDIGKWDEPCFVYCIEPEEDMIKEFWRRRAQNPRGPHKVIKAKIRDWPLIINNVHNHLSLISLFFVMNDFSEDDMRGLMKVIDELCLHNCKVIGAFLDADFFLEASSESFETKKLDNEKYFIKIKGTRIAQTEHEFRINTWEFSRKMEKRGFVLTISERLDFGTNLSEDEISLSSMFRIFEYSRGAKRFKSLRKIYKNNQTDFLYLDRKKL